MTVLLGLVLPLQGFELHLQVSRNLTQSPETNRACVHRFGASASRTFVPSRLNLAAWVRVVAKERRRWRGFVAWMTMRVTGAVRSRTPPNAGSSFPSSSLVASRSIGYNLHPIMQRITLRNLSS